MRICWYVYSVVSFIRHLTLVQLNLEVLRYLTRLTYVHR